jgi:hypothetical protein
MLHNPPERLAPVYAIVDRIDEAHERALEEQRESLATDTRYMAKHGWVRGPLDADGKLWHSGDMSDSIWGAIEGIAYEDGRWYVCGHDTSAPWIPADSIRHAHEPTVKDVLRELLHELGATWQEHYDNEDSVVTEYAEKVRKATKHEHDR